MEATLRRAKAPWVGLIVAGAAAFALFAWNPAQSQEQSGTDLINWRTDLDSARTEALASGKQLMVFFSASWCPDCQYAKSHVFSDASIAGRVNSQYVPVYVDDDNHPDLVKQYNIHEIPEYFVIDPKDKTIQKEFRHGALRRDDFKSWLP